MKVFHINYNYEVSSLYEKLTTHLIENDIDTKVFYPVKKARKGITKTDFLEPMPILSKYDRLVFKRRNRKVINHLKNVTTINKYDLIHAHSLFSNGYAAYSLNKEFDLPYVVAVRNTDVNVFFKKMWHLRKTGLKILKKASAIICLSKSYKELLLKKYIPKSMKEEIEEKIYIIPNGIDPFWLKNKTLPKEGRKNKKLNIVTVGYINKNKNAITTARACKILIDKYNWDIELKIIGDVQDESYFKKLQSYPFVKHLPYQPKEKLIEEYRKSDIFIMPSFTETFGLSYAEAMSQGLPVIYSKGQGFDKQFEEGVVGFRVESNNEKDIVNKIHKITNNYEDLTVNCYNLADKFSWRKIASIYRDIYSDVKSNS